jgi:hypothetical protein
MISKAYNLLIHTQRLHNVNQFLQNVRSLDSGGTIRTDTGEPVTSGGWAVGAASGIPTTTYKTNNTRSPKKFPHPGQIMQHMADYKAHGVSLLGAWNPDPKRVTEASKKNLQIDAVSLHHDEDLDKTFKERPQEKAAFNLDTFEERANPYHKDN